MLTYLLFVLLMYILVCLAVLVVVCFIFCCRFWRLSCDVGFGYAWFSSITRALHGCRRSFTGTHASSRAGQHFELFDSIFDIVKEVTTHINIVYAYSM